MPSAENSLPQCSQQPIASTTAPEDGHEKESPIEALQATNDHTAQHSSDAEMPSAVTLAQDSVQERNPLLDIQQHTDQAKADSLAPHTPPISVPHMPFSGMTYTERTGKHSSGVDVKSQLVVSPDSPLYMQPLRTRSMSFQTNVRGLKIGSSYQVEPLASHAEAPKELHRWLCCPFTKVQVTWCFLLAL